MLILKVLELFLSLGKFVLISLDNCYGTEARNRGDIIDTPLREGSLDVHTTYMYQYTTYIYQNTTYMYRYTV